MFSFYSIHVFISGPFSLYISAHRGGHAQNNYSSVVYTAAPQETAAVSGFKQMISRLDTATSAVLHQLCGELQHQSSRHRIKHLFATSSDQTRLHANTLWTLGVLSEWRRSRQVDCRGRTQRRLLTAWPCQVRSGGSAASWRGPCSQRSWASPGRMPGDTSWVGWGVGWGGGRGGMIKS